MINKYIILHGLIMVTITKIKNIILIIIIRNNVIINENNCDHIIITRMIT